MKKLIIIYKKSEHRIVFKINDFIIIKFIQLTRFDGVFLHELFKDKFKFFTRLIMMKDFEKSKLDLILQTSYFKMFDIVKIIELPEIECKKHYIINVKRVIKDDKTRRLKRKGFILLLNLNYDIQFT